MMSIGCCGPSFCSPTFCGPSFGLKCRKCSSSCCSSTVVVVGRTSRALDVSRTNLHEGIQHVFSQCNHETLIETEEREEHNPIEACLGILEYTRLFSMRFVDNNPDLKEEGFERFKLAAFLAKVKVEKKYARNIALTFEEKERLSKAVESLLQISHKTALLWKFYVSVRGKCCPMKKKGVNFKARLKLWKSKAFKRRVIRASHFSDLENRDKRVFYQAAKKWDREELTDLVYWKGIPKIEIPRRQSLSDIYLGHDSMASIAAE